MFNTPLRKFYAGLLLALTVIFGALTALSFSDGTVAFNQRYTEEVFEEEEIDPRHVHSFSLSSDKLCMIKVKGLTLDQSWVWISVLIVDEADRPVVKLDYNLSYYHGYEGGESWSEGDKDDYKLVRLPAGSYKVLVHGEDEPDPKPREAGAFQVNLSSFTGSSGYSTISRPEAVQVIITRGVWMTRYFMTLFLLFGSLLAIYAYLRSERAKTERYIDSDETWDPSSPPHLDPTLYGLSRPDEHGTYTIPTSTSTQTPGPRGQG